MYVLQELCLNLAPVCWLVVWKEFVHKHTCLVDHTINFELHNQKFWPGARPAKFQAHLKMPYQDN